MDKFEIDYKDNLEFKVTRNKLLLPGFCSAKQYILVLSGPYFAKYHIPKDIPSMIEFDMMHSSLSANPRSIIINQRFLTSMAN